MKLVDKINEMHEKYVFPLSNGLLIPYIGVSAARNYRGQLERARSRDQRDRHWRMYENENGDMTKSLNFAGAVMGLQLFGVLYQEYGGYAVLSVLIANGASHIYEKARTKPSSRDSTQLGAQ